MVGIDETWLIYVRVVRYGRGRRFSTRKPMRPPMQNRTPTQAMYQTMMNTVLSHSAGLGTIHKGNPIVNLAAMRPMTRPTTPNTHWSKLQERGFGL